MRNYKTILALDPSGSFCEGKGTTGWCLCDGDTRTPVEVGYLSATDYDCMESYWEAHVELIEKYQGEDTIIVIEDYLLYASKAQEQVNSRMETPKLIGVLQHQCWTMEQDYIMQLAAEVKNRWTDEILAHKGFIVKKGKGFALSTDPTKPINRHCKDAIRHAVHFAYFKNKEK